MKASWTLALGLCAISFACSDSDATTPAGVTEQGGAGSAAIAGASGAVAAAGSAGAPMKPGTAGQPAARAAGSGASPAAAGMGGGAPTAGAPAAGGGAGGATAGASGAAGVAGGTAPSADCDRACLLQFMQSYLDAVVAHDPTLVKLSPSLKMTDNGATAKPGDGLWQTATMVSADARLDFADPVSKNVASHVLINEGSTPVMYQVRLKVESREITEVETITVREADAANGFFDPANLEPQPVFLQTPAKRADRAQLMAITEQYLDYLEGKRSGSEVPFDENCARYENGVSTASGTSAFEFQSWSFEVTRRVLVIDEEAGITFGMFPFMQSEEALVVGEAFKIFDDKIMMIQAIMAYMPSKAWSE